MTCLNSLPHAFKHELVILRLLQLLEQDLNLSQVTTRQVQEQEQAFSTLASTSKLSYLSSVFK